MIAELKQLDIQQVEGDLVIDISAFTGQDKAPEWIWNDMTQYFSHRQAPRLLIKIASQLLYIVVRNRATLLMSILHLFTLDVIPGELNRYILTGCLTQRC